MSVVVPTAPAAPIGTRPSPIGGARERTHAELLDALIERSILSGERAEAALDIYYREGGWIGYVLLAYGFCHRLELFETWAQVLGLPSANLLREPPPRELVRKGDVDSMLQDRWVPWRLRKEDGTPVLVVASSDPDRVPTERIAAAFGVRRVELAIATDWDVMQAVCDAAGDIVADHAAGAIECSRPDLSARFGMSRGQKLAGVSIAVGMAALASWNPFVGLATLLWLLNIVFISSIGMKGLLFAFGAGAVRKREEARLRHIRKHGRPPERPRIPDSDLPVYTILVPAYREANVVSSVLENIRRIDYPLSKLQVLLLLEADDVETIAAAKATRTPDFLRIVVVPPGEPRTKPRACNVGLQIARGEYLVIYDAEDRPDPGQLREVVAQFREDDDELCCVQARLNYYNSAQNFITRMFTLEYCLWFDYLLPGLERLGMPIPLGGTSNHFKVGMLRELCGWDPWNVTEDADLGVRATSLGYRVATADSTTWEEACPEWWPWIRQRTRWIKGFMMTTIVHTRSLPRLYRCAGWRGIATLLLFIAGTPAAFLLYPIVVIAGAYGLFALPLPNFRLPGPLPELSTVSLVLGTSTMVVLSAASARRRRKWSILGYATLNPIYWLMHSFAAWRAVKQLIRKPSHWEKTPHGLSEASQVAAVPPGAAGETEAGAAQPLAGPRRALMPPVEFADDGLTREEHEEAARRELLLTSFEAAPRRGPELRTAHTQSPKTRGEGMALATRELGHAVLQRRIHGYAPEAVDQLLARATSAIQEVSRERDDARTQLERARNEIELLRSQLEHQRRVSSSRGEALLSRLIGTRGPAVP